MTLARVAEIGNYNKKNMPHWENPPTDSKEAKIPEPVVEKAPDESDAEHPIAQLKRELLLQNPELAIDKDWFEAYVEIEKKLPPTLDALAGNPEKNQASRTAFDRGDMRNPLFSYENIDPAKYDQAETSLLTLKERVKQDMESGDEERKEAGLFYLGNINRQLATYRMLKIIGEQRGQTEDPKISARRSRNIQRYADFFQEKPSRQVFKFFLDAMKEKVSNTDATNNPNLAKARDELLAVLPDFSEEAASLTLNPQKQQEFENLVQTELTDVFHVSLEYDPNQKHPIQQIFDDFDAATKDLNPNWKAVWKAGNTASAEPVRQELRVGEKMALQGNGRQKNLTHEMTHVERSAFAHTKLLVLRIGLPGYKASEEGITTAKELALYGESNDFGGYHSYIGTALGRGIEKKGFEKALLKDKEWDLPPRDFHDVYDFYYKFFLFDKLKGKPASDDIEAEKKAASDDAWNRAKRIFRGSNGQTQGYAYSSETSYGEGAFKTWGVINKSENVARTYKLMHKGKFDVTNLKHTRGLLKLGIITLEELRGITDEELEAAGTE